MDYNFRVLAHLIERTVVFQIHDVYYNDEDALNAVDSIINKVTKIKQNGIN